MNQKKLEATIRLVLLECLPKDWKLPIIAGYQPTGQGREDGVYFFRINDGKRGWLSRKYSEEDEDLRLKETQISESMYQFGALVKDDIRDDDQLLAIDVLDIVRSTISGLVMVESLIEKRIGVQRPTEILNPSFINEKDQFDFNPNFTVIFTHKRDLTQQVPHTETVIQTVQHF